MNFSCISAHIPSSCHSPVAKTILVSSAALLLITGIWQLSSPFMGKSPAAGWAFIGVAGLEVGFVIFLVMANKRKNEASKSNLEALSTEILLHIFSFLDSQSIEKIEQVCKAFKQEVRSKEFWTFISKQPQSKRLFEKRTRLLKHREFQNGFEKGLTSFQKFKATAEVSTLFYADDFLFTPNHNGIGIWKFDETTKTWNEQHILATQPPTVLLYCEETLFSVCRDKIIRAWKPGVKGNELDWDYGQFCRLDGHDSIITCLSYGKKMLFSGDESGKVKIWKRNEGNWICVNTLDTTPKTEALRPLNLSVQALFYVNESLVVCKTSLSQIWKPKGKNEGWSLVKEIKKGSIGAAFWAFSEHIFSEHIFNADTVIEMLKSNKKNQNDEIIQTLEVLAVLPHHLFMRGNLFFAKFNTGELKVAKLEKNQKWKWVQSVEFKNPAAIGSLFYADGKLFSGSSDEIRVWSV